VTALQLHAVGSDLHIHDVIAEQHLSLAWFLQAFAHCQEFGGWQGVRIELLNSRQCGEVAELVDRVALEMRSTGNRTGGSNPSLSAIHFCKLLFYMK
jgi:hypothetical protein